MPTLLQTIKAAVELGYIVSFGHCNTVAPIILVDVELPLSDGTHSATSAKHVQLAMPERPMPAFEEMALVYAIEQAIIDIKGALVDKHPVTLEPLDTE